MKEKLFHCSLCNVITAANSRQSNVAKREFRCHAELVSASNYERIGGAALAAPEWMKQLPGACRNGIALLGASVFILLFGVFRKFAMRAMTLKEPANHSQAPHEPFVAAGTTKVAKLDRGEGPKREHDEKPRKEQPCWNGESHAQTNDTPRGKKSGVVQGAKSG